MEKEQRKSLQSSDRFVGGGIYLPSQKYINRTIGLVLLLLTVLLIGIATRADAGERPANYSQHIKLGGFITTADIGFRF